MHISDALSFFQHLAGTIKHFFVRFGNPSSVECGTTKVVIAVQNLKQRGSRTNLFLRSRRGGGCLLPSQRQGNLVYQFGFRKRLPEK